MLRLNIGGPRGLEKQSTDNLDLFCLRCAFAWISDLKIRRPNYRQVHVFYIHALLPSHIPIYWLAEYASVVYAITAHLS